jgi:uncharacterized protein YlxW (UPF0749 family)
LLNKHIVTVSTIAAIAIGFLISLQFQAQKEVDAAEKIRRERVSQIQSVMDSLQEKNKQLLLEQERINNELKRYTDDKINNPFLVAKLEELKISDGTLAVQGPGVKMVIQDSGPNVQTLFVIDTDDLRKIINTLRFAGAEAISVNGQRIVANSSVVMSGSSTILINMAPIGKIGGTTYEILAIGEQDTLVDYLTKLEASELRQLGMQVEITREIVKIPAYKGGYTYNYAQKISD